MELRKPLAFTQRAARATSILPVDSLICLDSSKSVSFDFVSPTTWSEGFGKSIGAGGTCGAARDKRGVVGREFELTLRLLSVESDSALVPTIGERKTSSLVSPRSSSVGSLFPASFKIAFRWARVLFLQATKHIF